MAWRASPAGHVTLGGLPTSAVSVDATAAHASLRFHAGPNRFAGKFTTNFLLPAAPWRERERIWSRGGRRVHELCFALRDTRAIGAARTSITDTASSNLGPKLGPITPKQHGEPASTRYQKTRPANKVENRAESAKPPSPVQIRAAPPNPSRGLRGEPPPVSERDLLAAGQSGPPGLPGLSWDGRDASRASEHRALVPDLPRD
jgi:hypothetical protein